MITGFKTLLQNISPQTKTWITTGHLNATASDGATTFIGGRFACVGPYTSSDVPVTTRRVVALSCYPQANVTVNVSIPNGAGGLFIGGLFITVSNSANTWNYNANNDLRVLVLSGTLVFDG